MVRIVFGLAALLLTLSAGYVNAADGFRLLQVAGKNVKWGSPEFGTGASMTYAVLYGGESFAGERNCVPTGGLESLLERSRLSRAEFEFEVSQAFAVWSGVANIRFRMVADAASADIVIGAQSVPRGRAYADIAIGESLGADIVTIEKGIVCLNPKLHWTAGLPGSSADDRVSLRYALAHEIGHLLALDHPGSRGALMSFVYDDSIAGLQPGDIAGVVALYGPPVDGVTLTGWISGGETVPQEEVLPSDAGTGQEIFEAIAPIPVALSEDVQTAGN